MLGNPHMPEGTAPFTYVFRNVKDTKQSICKKTRSCGGDIEAIKTDAELT
jgi:hypothetical protein